MRSLPNDSGQTNGTVTRPLELSRAFLLTKHLNGCQHSKLQWSVPSDCFPDRPIQPSEIIRAFPAVDREAAYYFLVNFGFGDQPPTERLECSYTSVNCRTPKIITPI
jgi:hypothetical protein